MIKNKTFQMQGARCRTYQFTAGVLCCVSLSRLCGKHSQGGGDQVETSAPCFLNSCNLTFPKSIVRAVWCFCFLNVAWQRCGNASFFKPLLDMTTDGQSSSGGEELPGRENEFLCTDSSLSSFSVTPIFHDSLILSHFPLQIAPCACCANWHISIQKYFANNIPGLLNPSPLPPLPYLGIKWISANSTTEDYEYKLGCLDLSWTFTCRFTQYFCSLGFKFLQKELLIRQHFTMVIW